MNPHDCLTYLATHGMETVTYIHTHGATAAQRRDLADTFNLPYNTIMAYYRCAERFNQAPTAAEYATRHHFSLTHLTIISTAAGQLPPDHDQASFLTDMLHACHGATTSQTRTIVRDHLRRLCTEHPQPWRRWVRCSTHPDAHGMCYIMAKLNDTDCARIHMLLDEHAKQLQHTNPTLSYQQAMADAFVNLITQPPTTQPSPPTPRREGVILIPADGYRHIGSQMLATTDGARIPAHELANHLLADYGYAIIYDEHCEPVDLYRTKRLANTKQRLILTIDQLLCAEPSCQYLAATSQAHHITAWQHGGETNLNNLIAVCKAHHSENDDDHTTNHNGYYCKDPHTHQAAHQHPNRDTLTYNNHALAQASAHRWAQRHFGYE